MHKVLGTGQGGRQVAELDQDRFIAGVARETAQAARSGAGLLEEAGGVVGGLGAVVGQSNAAMERLATLSGQIGSLEPPTST